MTNTPFIYAKQNTVKGGFDFSPWGGIEGFLETSRLQGAGDYTQLKRLVPDLAHAVDMTAVAISSLPFDILDESDEIYDSSTNWKNNLGGMPNPQRLIYLLASSLCGGSAYILPTRTPKMIFDLQYCAPHTITPYWGAKGLQWFDRITDDGASSRVYPNGIIYFWLPDSDIEEGPAKNHPLGNATLDAQVIYNMKNTMRMYGERGFVPITLLGAKGMLNQGEREKAEGFFDRLLRGGFKTLAKIINSDALTLIKVGAGMEELKHSYIELRRDAKESIADAFGIPTALFMSDNAFASEFDALRLQWYTASRFVGIYQTIRETFNDQILKQYKKHMRFNLEALDVFQEDEESRTTSLGLFVSAVETNPKVAELGMEILGFDLDEKQQNKFAVIIKDKEAERDRVASQTQPNDAPANAPQDSEDEPADEIQETAKAHNAIVPLRLSADEIKDLALWYDRAKQWHAKGKGTAVNWECKHLREEIAAPIRMKLADAGDEADITAAFGINDAQTTQTPAPVYDNDSIKSLADSIEAAVKAITTEPNTPPAPSINVTMPNITLTAQMPPNGTVTVNLPEQPAPVVNVSNAVSPTPVEVRNEVNVSPTPVSVQNEVTVQPANVVMEKEGRRTALVKRDAKGNITEITSKES